MKKSIAIAAIIISLFVFSLSVGAETYSGVCGTNVNWSLDTESGALEITGYGSMSNYEAYTYAPWYSYRSYITKINISPFINAIGDYAFYYCRNVSSVIIPDSVKSIGASAFEWTGLVSIYIPESVVSIGDNAFRYNSNLTIFSETGSYAETYATGSSAFTGNFVPISGYCGDDVEYLIDVENDTLVLSGTGTTTAYNSGRYTPWANWANIKTVVVENGITYLPSYIFEYMTKVETIVLPNTLEKLAYNAFNDCTSLNNLMLPASLNEFTNTLGFLRCSSLTDVYYARTEADFAEVTNSNYAAQGGMTIHFLVEIPTTATCTQAGRQRYYIFDDTSVYDSRYDENGEEISVLKTVAALGHDTITHDAQAPTYTEVGWNAYTTCSRCDYTTYAELPVVNEAADIDGDFNITIKDVLLSIKAILNGTAIKNGDMNGDGKLSLLDVLRILKLSA